MNPQVHTPPKPGTGTPPSPLKLRQQHAVFPLAEGEVSLSFPADLSVASAQIMASFVNLLLKQAQQQAKIRMRPNYVKAYVKRNKHDVADAEAICESVRRLSMRSVPLKTVEQQSALMMHRRTHDCKGLVSLTKKTLASWGPSTHEAAYSVVGLGDSRTIRRSPCHSSTSRSSTACCAFWMAF